LLLSPWPVEAPTNWVGRVNQNEDERELDSLRRSVQRGRPFGTPEWQMEIAKRLGLESKYRPTGRPRKAKQQDGEPAA
jgi:putative transposase